MKNRIILIFTACIYSFCFQAQDTIYLKVHFLYGSKPVKKYKKQGYKSFGGILGGHVGIELNKDKILNFVPSGKFHWIRKKNNKHSAFVTHDKRGFYGILGGTIDSVKRLCVYIPVSLNEAKLFDSIYQSYRDSTPYDYAFFGMRCGASSYEILSQIGILERYSNMKTVCNIFYPKKLRKKLLKLTIRNNWQIKRSTGTKNRKWEKD